MVPFFFRNSKTLIITPAPIDPEIRNDFTDGTALNISKHFSKTKQFHYYSYFLKHGSRATCNKVFQMASSVDVVFYFLDGTSYLLPLEVFISLRERGIKLVLWVLDDELIFDTISKHFATFFDAAVTCDGFSLDAYRKLGAQPVYYFSAYSSDDFHPVTCVKDIDVSFVGNCSKSDRGELLDHLRENGIRVDTFGDGSKSGFLPKEKIKEIFSRTKINLNFTKINSPDDEAWFLHYNLVAQACRQNKGRPAEIALCRAFCLSEESPSLAQAFVPKEELDTFRDKHELLAMVRHYLADDAAREAIANKAYLKAQRYEVDTYFPVIMSELEEKLSAGRLLPYLSPGVDPAFRLAYANQMMFIVFSQISKGYFFAAVESFILIFHYDIWLSFRGALSGITRSYRHTSRLLRNRNPAKGENINQRSTISVEHSFVKIDNNTQTVVSKKSLAVTVRFSQKMRDWKKKENFQPTLVSSFYNPSFIIRKSLFKAIRDYAHYMRGRMLDFGCGSRPYENLFSVDEYIGVDIVACGHDHCDSKIDAYYDGNHIPFPDKHFDSVFSSEVFEHIFNPDEILSEIFRVTIPGGRFLLTTPFIWEEHEAPYDFARYTSFGLEQLLSRHGFRLIKQKKTTTSLETIIQSVLAWFSLTLFSRYRVVRWLFTPIVVAPLNFISSLSCILPDNGSFYCNNVIVAERLEDNYKINEDRNL